MSRKYSTAFSGPSDVLDHLLKNTIWPSVLVAFSFGEFLREASGGTDLTTVFLALFAVASVHAIVKSIARGADGAFAAVFLGALWVHAIVRPKLPIAAEAGHELGSWCLYAALALAVVQTAAEAHRRAIDADLEIRRAARDLLGRSGKAAVLLVASLFPAAVGQALGREVSLAVVVASPFLAAVGQAQDREVPPAVASAFVARCVPAAREVQSKTGVPSSILVAMACQESIYGTAYKLTAKNNYFGLMDRKFGSLREFQSLEECFEVMAEVLQRPPYEPALRMYAETYARTGSGSEATIAAIAELCRRGWCPEPSYVPEVRRIIASHLSEF